MPIRRETLLLAAIKDETVAVHPQLQGVGPKRYADYTF